MDYELKYVIAICFIVKIAALSPEFSINEETEKLEQIPTRMEAPFLQTSTAEKALETSFGVYNPRMLFNRNPGREKFDRMNHKKDVAKTQRIMENQSFDTCEHKLKLLQSSLKWRDIQQTLHWLGRILASNETNILLCNGGKNIKQSPSFHGDFYNSKTKFRKEKFFKKKKTNWAKNLRSDFETNTYTKNEKPKKEHKKYWKIHSKKEKYKSKRNESKKKLKNFSSALNTTTILKPNLILKPLFDFKKIFFKKTKTKGKHFTSQKCNDSSELVKTVKNCEKESRENEWERQNHTERWPPELKLREQNRENKSKSPKPKPWPHFVYHRVSSNFLHSQLTGQNHGKSAYIAISVVNGDSTDNNDI